jgi:hypothetical protein
MPRYHSKPILPVGRRRLESESGRQEGFFLSFRLRILFLIKINRLIKNSNQKGAEGTKIHQRKGLL